MMAKKRTTNVIFSKSSEKMLWVTATLPSNLNYIFIFFFFTFICYYDDPNTEKFNNNFLSLILKSDTISKGIMSCNKEQVNVFLRVNQT